MRLLVHLADQRRDRTDSHGIINFSLGLVHALPAALGPEDQLVVLANEAIGAELDRSALRAQDDVRMVPTPASTWERLVLDHRGVARHAREVGADVVLYPKGFLPLRPARRRRHAVVLHDDIPARLWEDPATPRRRRARAGYFTGLLRHSVRHADVRLFVSSFTADRLTGRWGGPRPGDAVVLEGITLSPQPVRSIAERAPQAVVLGSSLRHKRTAAGLRMLAALSERVPAIERIVVVGHLPADTPAGLDIDHRPGPLGNDELADLYAASRVLVYPSEYEGYGLPPLEAYACGTPAVYRETGVTAEVMGHLPGLFRDERAEDLAAALEEVLALDEAELAERQAQVRRRHDWAAVATRVVAALRT